MSTPTMSEGDAIKQCKSHIVAEKDDIKHIPDTFMAN